MVLLVLGSMVVFYLLGLLVYTLYTEWLLARVAATKS